MRQRQPRNGLIVVALAIFALLITACGGGGDTGADPGDTGDSPDGTEAQAGDGGDGLEGDVVKLGAIVPSSGPFSEWGKTNTVALNWLQEQINSDGGVGGVELQIEIYDDAAEPDQAANLVRRLAQDDEVLAIAGPLTSSSAEVAFPVCNQVGIVCMSQASSKPGVAGNNRPWAFRNTVDEAKFANVTVPTYKEEFGIESVATIYDSQDANSTNLATELIPQFMEDNGIEVLNKGDELSFQTGDVDVSAQVTNLKNLDPDGVVVAADYSQAITVLREMSRQDFERPVIGGSPLISSAILDAAPAVPIVAPATFYPGVEDEDAQQFVQAIQQRIDEASDIPEGVEPSMYDANITEITNIFVSAIEESGVTNSPDELEQDREKIRDYIAEAEEFEGWLGSISFDEEGEAVKNFFVVLGQDGEWTPIAEGTS